MVVSNIDPHLAEQLISQAIIRDFGSRDRITIPYDHPRSVPFVTAGTVKVFYQLSSGEELLLYYLEPSQYCIMSMLAAVRQVPNSVYGIAETPTTIAFVPIEHFLTILSHQPLLLEHLIVSYHKRFEELLDLIAQLKFSGLRERLLELLWHKSHLHTSRTIYTTHEELAHELGTSRVVVSRLLKELENNGTIVLGRKYITLTSPM
jgi:CRP/FNR family transcriptional regulator